MHGCGFFFLIGGDPHAKFASGICVTSCFSKRRAKFGRHSSQHASGCQVPTVPYTRSPQELKPRKFQLNMTKNFFTLRVTKPWPRLPREVVESPSLEIFQTCLDKVLCSLLWVTLLGQGGWTR